jgi:plastocyanin
MKSFRAIACLAAIVAALGLIACGGDDDSSETTAAETTATTEETGGETGATGATGSAGGATTLDLSADPSGALAYTETELEAPAGSVTIEFTNESPVQHDVAVSPTDGSTSDDPIGKTAVISEGSETLELSDLEPGEYQYWCTVPGHLEAGMEGTLTVK